ncbi:alcohol dehydrogenase [Mucilaginibacter sp. PPCGB 2223]|uniref:zinc-dependent alcohol dehydrogenase family protein n=1 Tax=Mucilaginibacter sp. PPCGB 2223 TaxID=1886027 RepID=UPI000825BD0F|nr:zinc-dependent alcohol dehydrogenase family protein [Mucilaginibacter sp. PPCGB 2223]OCX54838.1 alcohol dehydrogenase [Mucilaginibacter sp. PPCGB 2223]
MKHPESMQAMVLEAYGTSLVLKQLNVPAPNNDQVLIKVTACGICRTDLHIIDGELPEAKFPLIPGHEIIGRVVACGSDAGSFKPGDIVGVPWLGYTCGTCKFCLQGRENLCDNAGFTGYTINGGFAEYTVADARFCFLLGTAYQGPENAPLLCAGLIGYRSYRMIRQSAKNIGIYGFGAAAHIITQIAKAEGKNIFAFTKRDDQEAQAFALRMGAAWAGESGDTPPERLDASMIFAPAGELVVKALGNTDKGGEVICGGIHMTDIPSFSYSILWQERSLRSVANLTRKDGADFFSSLKKLRVVTQTQFFKLADANTAINLLRTGKINGAAVLLMP